ncbi:hypothetical protein ACMA5I_11210 [Paracoccaceae bacterium GXU_MW_L88]
MYSTPDDFERIFMYRLLTFFGLFLILTGCLGSEVTLTIKDDENAVVEFALPTEREIYDQLTATSGLGFCEGGESDVSEEIAICRRNISITVDELIAGLTEDETGRAVPKDLIIVRRLPQNELEIRVKVAALIVQDTATAGTHLGDGTPIGPKETPSERFVVLNITAPDIIETTGTLSEDGKRRN